MRLILWIFVLMMAIACGLFIHQDPGYALFAYQNWTLEMPLWLALMGVVALVLFLMFCLNTLKAVTDSSDKVKHWWLRRQKEIARLQTTQGLLELTEGRWQKAEQYLIKSAQKSDAPLINYLSAAKAAEEAGACDRRDHYLQLAFHVGAESEIAVRLTQAQLHYKQGEFDKSLETLEQLYSQRPRHPYVLKLLSTLYEAQEAWEALFKLLPVLRKEKICNEVSLNRLEQKVYAALLPKISDEGFDRLNIFWKEAPKSIQKNSAFIFLYAQGLLKQSNDTLAEKIIREALEKTWDDRLVLLYGKTKASSKKQIAFIEKMMQTRILVDNHFDWEENLPSRIENYSTTQAHQAIALLTLGRLLVQNQLWVRAQECFEKSLALRPHPEAYAELGEVFDRLGRPLQRDACFKKGLLLAMEIAS